MAATMAGGSRKLKYEKMLEKKRHQRELEEKQVDDWMNKYDTDGNGMIEKGEFEKLIQGVYGGQGVAVEPRDRPPGDHGPLEQDRGLASNYIEIGLAVRLKAPTSLQLDRLGRDHLADHVEELA